MRRRVAVVAKCLWVAKSKGQRETLCCGGGGGRGFCLVHGLLGIGRDRQRVWAILLKSSDASEPSDCCDGDV